MKSIFDAHGQLEIFLEGRILIVRGTDSPNIEMVDEFNLRVEEFYQLLEGAPWGSLTYLFGDVLFPPDAVTMIESNFRRMISLGLCGIAVVISDTQYPMLVRDFWVSIYEKVGISYQFFEDPEDAKSWLLSKINAG